MKPHYSAAMGRWLSTVLVLWSAAAVSAVDNPAARGRTLISLNGEWQIAEGSKSTMPDRFDHTIPVPGLADMARPPFAGVGETNDLREAFWYRRQFTVPGDIPPSAEVKLHKAAYGAKVWVNGRLLGERQASFTPGYFDVHRVLRGGNRTNEIVVRVLAHRRFLPAGASGGWDFEKIAYIPGLFDSVELILSGTPHIEHVQTVPHIASHSVRVQALLRNQGQQTVGGANFVVRELKTGKVVGASESSNVPLNPGEAKLVEGGVTIEDCHLWSPEDPFLYELETTTGADTVRTRFGMRSFHLDPRSGHAVLNGRPYFLRGSNVTLYRFFEDSERRDRPWREDWVRLLHRRFKEMHWNSLRYCIGFPPDRWYDIADEEGILIQDEYPLWHLSGDRLKETWPPGLDAAQLAREYTEWMQERWNHPSVVIWDAQNETATEETGKAIQMVRSLDLSNRPWDNGWSTPQAPGDVFESHPYLAQNPDFKLRQLATLSGVPRGNVIENKNHNPIIINEYGWLWLNRDGSPTTLTKQVYRNLLGEFSTLAQRRHLYARWLAAKTEFWRAHRACAGVLHFCGLGYSRPDGQTSDHFTDLETLTFEPEFERYVRPAFAPIGLMVNVWEEQLVPQLLSVPVIVTNDTGESWDGTVRLRLQREGTTVDSQSLHCLVDAFGQQTLVFTANIPDVPGGYQLEAELSSPGGPALSVRDFMVTGAK